MVYFLKFGASWVLPPGIFILALFGVSIYLWRKRYERKAAVLLFVLTFLFYLLCTTFVSAKILSSGMPRSMRMRRAIFASAPVSS